MAPAPDGEAANQPLAAMTFEIGPALVILAFEAG
jgi:hypothetical protein